MAIDLRNIEKLLLLAKKYKLTEFELNDGKFHIHFKTSRAPGAVAASSPVTTVNHQPVQASAPSPLPVAAPSAATSHSAHTDEGRYHKVLSPFVGTFYRAPSPEAEPYVKDGQTIRKGDVLCIVEAMKLMNEIESEISGKVVSCLVENGQPVEYGEPLFMVDPL